jgi:hypothetical protein
MLGLIDGSAPATQTVTSNADRDKAVEFWLLTQTLMAVGHHGFA